MELPTGERASYNFYRVLRSIWRGSGISRTELAASHKLDKTTISQIVAELMEQRVVNVQEIDTSMTRPGRKSELLKVDDRWGYVVGMELRPDGVQACATDMHANVIAKYQSRATVERTNLQKTFVKCLSELQSAKAVAGVPLVGVGVGVSGIVDPESQCISKSIPLNIFEPFDFRSKVSDGLSVPVLIDNDANCGAWLELVRNAERRPRNFMFVLIEFRTPRQRKHYGGDVGIGLGLVIDGSVYYGRSGAAGEFRSIYWRPGHRNQVAASDEESGNVRDNPDLISKMIDELAMHIGLFANSLNLDAIYVGGDVAPVREIVVDAFARAIANNWPYDEEPPCSVELATLNDDIVAVGAASMILEHIFHEPLLPAGLRARNQIWQTILSARANVAVSKEAL